MPKRTAELFASSRVFDRGNGVRLESKRSYQPDFLNQEWETYTDAKSVLDVESLGLHATVTQAAIATCRGQSILCMDVTADVNQFLVSGDLNALEQALTGVPAQYVKALGQSEMGHPEWVVHYWRKGSEETIPDAWLVRDAASIRLVSEAGEGCVAIGWGNGIVEFGGGMKIEDWDEFVRGLIDAQIIWSELAFISDRTGLSLAVIPTEGKNARAERKQRMRQIEGLEGLLSSHQLAYDSPVLNI